MKTNENERGDNNNSNHKVVCVYTIIAKEKP